VKPSSWLLFTSQQSITRLPLWFFGSQLIDAPLRVLNHRLRARHYRHPSYRHHQG
jgi:hypothetical protein